MKLQNGLSSKIQIYTLFVMFTILIVIAGYLYYNNEEKQISQIKQDELSSIAKLKIKQISDWFSDELNDADIISGNDYLKEKIEKYLTKNDVNDKSALIRILDVVKTEHDYYDIYLTNKEGELILSTNSELISLDTTELKSVKKVINTKKTIASDLFKSSVNNKVYIDFVSPILNEDYEPNAVLILQMDPDKFLFPLIKSWPTPSLSSETFMFGIVDNYVVYLNELRHQSSPALEFKLPMTRKDLPAVQAGLGYVGIFEGKDYRGVEVLAYVSNIPNTKWYLVAKVDHDEIYAEKNHFAWILIGFMTLLILLMGVSITLIYQNRQRNIYKELSNKETKLWETQEKLKVTLESIGDAVITTGIDEKIDYMNRLAEELTGWKFRDARGRNLTDVYIIKAETTGKIEKNPIQKVMKSGIVKYLVNHTILISKDGKEIPIMDTGAPIYSNDGKIIGVVLAFQDETERRIREQKLKESEHRLRSTLDTMLEGCQIINKDWRYVYINEAAEKHNRRPKEDLLGNVYMDMWPGIEETNVFKIIKHCMDERTYQQIENEFTFSNGEKGWYYLSIQSMPEGILILSQDITERKRTEEKLKESESRFRKLYEDGANGMVMAGKDFKFMMANRTFCQMTGYQELELQQLTFTDITHPDDKANDIPVVKKMITGEIDVYRTEKRYVKKDGQTFWAQLTVSPIYDANCQFLYFVGIIVNVTERKRAEEALRQSEEKFSIMFRKAPFSAALSSIADLKLMEVNEQFEKYFGYSAEEAVGKTSEELGLYTDINDQSRSSTIFREQGFIRDVETKMRAKSGEVKHVLINSDIVKIGNEQFILSTAQDITARKKLEADRQKFFMLAECSSEFIGMCDLELKPLYVNPAGRRMVGLPDMEAACRVKVQDYYFPEDQQFIAEDFFPRVLRDGHGDVEIRLRHFQTGEAIWMYYYLFSVLDDSGIPIGWATVSRDITERRRAEVALRKSEQEFRDLAESMPQIVWATRADGWNIYFNQQWMNYTGMTLEESYGHGWNKPFHPDDQQRAWDAWQNAVNNKGIYSIEARLRRFDGEYRWWLVRGVPQLNEQGEILKWFGTCTDIEEMKQVEAEIQKLNAELELKVEQRTEQLEASNKELEAFSYSVSHDLRAPLRHINGYVDLLTGRYNDLLPEKGKQYLNTISDSAKQMGVLIDELLQFSKTGRQQLHIENIDMNNLLNEIIKKLKSETANRKIDWAISRLPKVLGDRLLLGLVWINLVGNAIKFTRNIKEAKIEIGFKKDEKNIIFYVRDNGVGFDMKYAQKLFGVFQRLHSQTEFEGTGIGLANVQRIIHKHGGKVWAEAGLNKGASFYFTLPIKTELKL